MNLSEEEYRKAILWMIGFALFIFITFTGLVLFMYRDNILSGTPPKYSPDSGYNDYQGGSYPSYPNDPPPVIESGNEEEYIEPENRSL